MTTGDPDAGVVTDVVAGVVASVADRHGVPVEQVRPIPSGVANHAYRLGDGLILRIPRSTAFAADLRKEAAVGPAARAAGVTTPEVVGYQDGTPPALVLRRVPGVDLQQLDLADRVVAGLYRAVGHELARLHELRPEEHPELSAVPVEADDPDPEELLDRLEAAGRLDADARRWLSGWFARLAARRPARPPVRLLHGDIAAQNLMVLAGPARLSGVIDWGDARWGDPAVDFAKVPLNGVVAMLAGYREERGERAGSDGGWEARVLWYHLLWALGRLEDATPRPGERHWTAPPASRLLGLLRFFAGGPPDPWPALA